MVWISFFLGLTINLYAKELPKFLTKHSIETLRYITSDGRYAYLQKRPGVLGLVSSFRSTDFISDSSKSDFIVKDSRFKQRLIIEIVPNAHTEYNLFKNHKIQVVDWGRSNPKLIGEGRSPKLHLMDEWISFYNAYERVITLQNILTQKKFEIKLSPKQSPFYTPEVEMITADTIVYTEINEKGYSALVQHNLITKKNNVLYRSNQTGTRIELCQEKGYLGIGEFPYDDIARSSKIMQIKLTGSTNLAGFTTIYSSTDPDLGNITCHSDSIYFIKTMTHIKKLNYKQTEAVKLDLKTEKIQTLTDLSTVTQIISMDGRVMVPSRGEFYVLEGTSNLSDDKLKAPTNFNEELPLEI